MSEDSFLLSQVSVPKTRTSKGVVVTVSLPKEQVEFLSVLAHQLGVRKGAIIMLGLGMLMKHFEKNEALYKEIARSPKRHVEVRKLFSRYNLELGDRDFAF